MIIFPLRFCFKQTRQRAIDLFFQIKKPDEVVLRIFFSACAQLKTENALTFGKKVFNQLINDSNQLDDLLNMVLNMFIKCGDLKSAESLFDRIDRNVVSYGSMMKFYNIQRSARENIGIISKNERRKYKSK